MTFFYAQFCERILKPFQFGQKQSGFENSYNPVHHTCVLDTWGKEH